MATKGGYIQTLILNLGSWRVGSALMIGFASIVVGGTDGAVVAGVHICGYMLEMIPGGARSWYMVIFVDWC